MALALAFSLDGAFYQSADGFGAAGKIGLFLSPGIEGREGFRLKADSHKRAGHRCTLSAGIII